MSLLEIAFGSVLLSFLVALSIHDVRTHRLPDAGTLPLTACGLFWSWLHPPGFSGSLIGAAGGYLVFAGIQVAYRALRGRDGLGGGDAKLLAAAGAWCGWQGLAPVVLIASAFGLIVSLPRATSPRTDPVRIAFGPFLSLAIAAVWFSSVLWPDQVFWTPEF